MFCSLKFFAQVALFMLHTILQKACEAAHWDYGEAWLIQPGNEFLQLDDAWFVHSDLTADRKQAWEQFRACSEKFFLRLGEGLPGRVGESQQPEWIVDVSAQSESYFLRNKIAIAFGAKAGFAIPIALESQSAVLAFFLSEARSPDDWRMGTTQAAAQAAIGQLAESNHLTG